ncbi:nucleotidyltransferase family protein [Aeromonas schubertii]|uniref:Nucleotidyltransferase n=1 Tax=Aeromonas schubertii TaxID=652 RepID=A0A0S2SD78_9GAMM|nr:nucleotidyltransferase domain-containing protein [Aeromonas schubertii]ALP39678.1 nucleotidyltransferase [Aeromonas schubertii]
MSMDVISLARDYLMERYRPHCIILYGSHARGDAGPSSDIDIVCFCDGVEARQDARPFHGTFLDGWIYPATALGSIDPEWLRFAGGQLLLDLTGEGKGLLERLDALLKAGRSPMSPQERASTLVWVEKMVARAGCDELDGHYRRTWLQYELLSLF